VNYRALLSVYKARLSAKRKGARRYNGKHVNYKHVVYPGGEASLRGPEGRIGPDGF